MRAVSRFTENSLFIQHESTIKQENKYKIMDTEIEKMFPVVLNTNVKKN
jgi:hypothetical protein